MSNIRTTQLLDRLVEGSTPLVSTLSSDVRLEINSQIAHLSKLKDEDWDESERFRIMTDGAMLVLNILENCSWGKEGTKNWLSHMDKRQLEYAKKEIEQLIKAKENEEKESVYVATCLGYVFVTCSESKANDWILKELKKITDNEKRVSRGAKKKNPFSNHEYNIGIDERKCRLSEINELLSEGEQIPSEHLVNSETLKSYILKKEKALFK